MTTAFAFEFHLSSEQQTTRFGQRLASLLHPGDTLLLQGPIGAGKTHLARALIQERLSKAGLLEDVPSPTYTLVQTYFDGDCEIWHADLYRLTDPEEVLEIGLDAAFDDAIVLIEWPDRLGSGVPRNALTIDLGVEGGGRRVRLSSPSEKWARLEPMLKELK